MICYPCRVIVDEITAFHLTLSSAIFFQSLMPNSWRSRSTQSYHHFFGFHFRLLLSALVIFRSNNRFGILNVFTYATCANHLNLFAFIVSLIVDFLYKVSIPKFVFGLQNPSDVSRTFP